ncbi:hypothetical protein AAF712_003295 [Marasmius tenuissimus]|uniref:Uncharacterized protein n=1 Tax=Marasmius tenuissimus TaxID=585030 RepID=A0ABR3A8D4_9AGAR
MSKVGTKGNNAVATSRFPAQWHLPFRNTITKTDRQNIAFLLSDAEKERKACASEVNKLKAALMALENRLDDAEKKEEYFRSLLSPIHRMPPEVMMEIFKVCCNSPGANSIPYSPSELPATSYPQTLHGMWPLEEHNCLHPIPLVQFECNWSTPLTLDIIYFDDTNRTHIGPDILGILASNSNRWKRVDFDIDAVRSRSPSFPATRGHLAVLTNLTIDCPMTGGRGYDGAFLRAFEDAPCLRSVTLRDGPAMADLVLPWHQLEVVQLGHCGIGRTLQLLKNCTGAVRLILDTIIPSIPEAATDNLIPLSLPTVRTLSLILTDSSIMSLLFKHLTLPGLETLSIRNSSFVGWNVPWDVQDFLSALDLCNLTSLTLAKVPLRDGDFISLLEVMPTLESLSFSESTPMYKPRKDPNNMTITPHVLARLSLAGSDFPPMMARPDTARLLPHLQHLSLCIYASNLDQRALGKAVLSRRPGSDASNDQNTGEAVDQRLRSFEVVVMLPDAKATASLELVSSLECLSDVGLRVRVKTETTKYVLGSNLESMAQHTAMSDISDSDDE